MSEIKCPECGKTISSFAKQCPTDGFPMASFLKKHGLNDFDKTWVCPKCGKLYQFTTGKQPICEYCNTIVKQCEESNKESIKNGVELEKNEYEKYEISLAKKYGKDQFSEEAYNHRMDELRKWREEYDRKEQARQSTQQQNVPHCPVCNSTNIEKISLGKKAKGSFLFGFFSSDVRNQMHCKDCGYKF